MSKDNEALEKKAKTVINGVRQDLAAISNFIAAGLVDQAMLNNGKLNKKLEKEEIEKILNAEQTEQNINNPVISLRATELKAEEEFNKLEKEGVNPKEFAEIREEMKIFRESITKKMSTLEGLNDLMNNKVKYQMTIGAMPFSGITYDEKIILTKQTQQEMNFPKDVSYFIASQDLSVSFSMFMKKKAVECFAISEEPFKGGLRELDKVKMNDKQQLSKFSALVSSGAVGFDILQKSFGNIKEQKGSVINSKINSKVVEKLLPALSKLGADYLNQHSKEIIEEISKSAYTNKAFWSYFSKSLSISDSNLDKIGKELLDKHLVISQKTAIVKPPQIKEEGTGKSQEVTPNKTKKVGKGAESKDLDKYRKSEVNAKSKISPAELRKKEGGERER